MATLPDLNALGPRPAPQLTQTPSAPNTSISDGLDAAASAAMKIGQVLEKREAETEVSAARAKINAWEQQHLYDGETGAAGKRMEDAFGIHEQLGKDFDTFAAEVMKGTKTNLGRGAVDGILQSRKLQVGRWAGNHEVRERKAFRSAAHESSMKSAADRVGANPDVLESELAAASMERQTFLKTEGINDPKVLAQATGEVRASLLNSVFAGLVARDQYADAEVMFAKHGEHLTSEHQEKYKRLIEQGTVLGAAQAHSDRIFATVGEGNRMGALAEARKIRDAKEREKTTSLVTARANAWSMAKRDGEDNLFRTLVDEVRQDSDPSNRLITSIDDIKLDVRRGLRPEQEKALEAVIAENVNGLPKVSDPKALSELYNMPPLQLANTELNKYAGKLNAADLKSFQTKIASAKKNPAGFTSQGAIAKGMLRQLGVSEETEKGREYLSRFDQHVMMLEEQGQHRSPAMLQDARKSLLQEILLEKKALLGRDGLWPDRSERLIDIKLDDVPESAVAELSELLRREGVTPTEHSIVTRYLGWVKANGKNFGDVPE